MNLKEQIALGVSAITIACTPAGPVERQPSATPIVPPSPTTERIIPTPTAVSTALPPTSTAVRIEATPPTLSIVSEDDIRIKRAIEVAESGQVLVLERPMVGHLARSVWEDGQAYLATLEALKSNNEKQILAFVLDSDCIFKDLESRNELGRSFIPGLWEPNRRVDTLEIHVSIPQTIVSPKSFIDADRIINRGQVRICEGTKGKDRLIDLLKDAPETAGEFTGWVIRKFGTGLGRGLNP